METRKYEITYIIRPDIEESAKSELVARFDKMCIRDRPSSRFKVAHSQRRKTSDPTRRTST